MQHRQGKKGKTFSGGQGRHAKGYLPEDTLRYYRHVADALAEGFETEDLKSVFLNNAIRQLSEEVVQVSQNQTVSRIIESLASHAKPTHLRKLFIKLSADYSVAFLDRFASHVFQTLIQLFPQYYVPKSFSEQTQKKSSSNDDSDDEDSENEKVEPSFQSLCQFVDKHFETVVTHTYGSHVMRALLEMLSGVRVAHEVKRGHNSKDSHQANGGVEAVKSSTGKLPLEFKMLFDKYAESIFHICDYEVHLKDSSFSPILQTVLLILHKTDFTLCQSRCRTIIQEMMETCPQSDNPVTSIPDMAQNQVGSYLLEVVFKLGAPDLLQEVYTSMLKDRLLYYSIHPVANFVLQRFIACIKDEDLMESVFDEMSTILEDILAVGHLGLVTCLAESCRRLQLKQEEFVSTLMAAFHCKEPDQRQPSLPRLIASFTAYEVFYKIDKETGKPPEGSEEPILSGPVNMHGSLLLQQLLQFDKPKFVAPTLAAMKPAELCIMCCDPAGSHVIDIFFSSHTVVEKNKDIFLKKLKGLFMEVACTKNGSRCLESVWKSLNVKQRTRVAEELVESEARLRGDRFGHFLHRNLALTQFVQRRQLWLEQQGAQSKRKRMMAELLHGKDSPTKKRKGEEDTSHIELQDEEEDQVTALFTKHLRNKPQANDTPPITQGDSNTDNNSTPQKKMKNDKKTKKRKRIKDEKEGGKEKKKTTKDTSYHKRQAQESDSEHSKHNNSHQKKDVSKKMKKKNKKLKSKPEKNKKH